MTARKGKVLITTVVQIQDPEIWCSVKGRDRLMKMIERSRRLEEEVKALKTARKKK